MVGIRFQAAICNFIDYFSKLTKDFSMAPWPSDIVKRRDIAFTRESKTNALSSMHSTSMKILCGIARVYLG